MSKFAGYNIKLEAADEKGMINGFAMIEYLQKAQNAVCQICVSDIKFGSGFFCKIPYTKDNNLLLPVLITNNHVLSKDSLEADIKIKINNETKIISLKDRKKWTNVEMDFTCIEIKEEEDKIYTYFNLDDKVLDKNYSNDNYLNHKVLIYGFNGGKMEMVFSNEVIKNNEDPFFTYTCNTLPGFSGGCVVNQFNNNVIGIHRGEIETGNKDAVNAGIYINNVINSIKKSKENISQKVKIIL